VFGPRSNPIDLAQIPFEIAPVDGDQREDGIWKSRRRFQRLRGSEHVLVVFFVRDGMAGAALVADNRERFGIMHADEKLDLLDGDTPLALAFAAQQPVGARNGDDIDAVDAKQPGEAAIEVNTSIVNAPIGAGERDREPVFSASEHFPPLPALVGN